MKHICPFCGEHDGVGGQRVTYTGCRDGDGRSSKEKNENPAASVIQRVCSEDEEG
jgi:hypothetical protein